MLNSYMIRPNDHFWIADSHGIFSLRVQFQGQACSKSVTTQGKRHAEQRQSRTGYKGGN